MRNDTRNGEVFPQVRRTVVSAVVSVCALIGAIGGGIVAVIDAVAVFASAGQGRVSADVPLPDRTVSEMLTGSPAPTELASTPFAPVIVSGVPGDIVASFNAAQAASLIVSLLLALIVGLAAIGTLLGRLRWGLLSWLTVGGGAILAVGSVTVQAMTTAAAEDLSMWLLSPNVPWLEPGFLAGFDFTPLVAGVVIMVLGWAFRGSARYARDADGVV